jgi:hypothetical protein
LKIPLQILEQDLNFSPHLILAQFSDQKIKCFEEYILSNGGVVRAAKNEHDLEKYEHFVNLEYEYFVHINDNFIQGEMYLLEFDQMLRLVSDAENLKPWKKNIFKTNLFFTSFLCPIHQIFIFVNKNL